MQKFSDPRYSVFIYVHTFFLYYTYWNTWLATTTAHTFYRMFIINVSANGRKMHPHLNFQCNNSYRIIGHLSFLLFAQESIESVFIVVTPVEAIRYIIKVPPANGYTPEEVSSLIVSPFFKIFTFGWM